MLAIVVVQLIIYDAVKVAVGLRLTGATALPLPVDHTDLHCVARALYMHMPTVCGLHVSCQ